MGKREKSQRNRRKSKNQENRVARLVDGKVTPGSGAFLFKKGDVDTPNFLIECKRTDFSQYILQLKTLEKIEKEAREKLKTPAVVVEIKTKSFVILKLSDFIDLFPGREV